MAPFDPYMHVIKPMLAESRETPFDSKDHIFELKWDGTRALAIVRDGLRFQNRACRTSSRGIRTSRSTRGSRRSWTGRSWS